VPAKIVDIEKHLLDNCIPEPNSGCWIWEQGPLRDGYGRVYFDGKMRQAHRATYEHFVGAIPDGMQLDHLCRLRCCVNPDHLEPVTQLENIRRGKRGFLEAHQRSKTHCPQGHEYSDENTYYSSKWHRRCRACHRAEANSRYHRIKGTP
jgi:hypothetical protein